MKEFLNDILKSSGSKLASVAADGLYTDNFTCTDTGSYMFNALLSGDLFKGIPGKITMLAGPTSVGKTYLLLSVCKHFLDMNEKHVIVYYESEGAITGSMLSDRNISTDRFVMIPVSTLEDFRTKCLNLLSSFAKDYKDSGYKMIICLDSLGMLSSAKEIEDTMEGKNTRDMTKAQVLKGIFRVLTLKLAELNVPMLVTNHVYAQMNCLSELSNVILHDDSKKSIKDVVVGDMVKTLVGNRVVTNTFEYEVDSIIEFKLSNGQIIQCTPNHKFLTEKLEWKTAEELDVKDKITTFIS